MKNFIAGIGLFCALTASGTAQERFVDETPQNRKVVLEEFTGVNCGNCPDGHRRANALRDAHPGEVFLINIHQGSYAYPAEIDLRTNYGDALASQAGINSYPNATINRHSFNGSIAVADRTAWTSLSEGLLSTEAYANIAAKATVDWQTREMQVTVQVYYTGNSPASTNYLNVALLQDYIYGPQAGMNANMEQVDGNQYVHMHALRDLITGQWGEEITTTIQGSFVEKTYTYTIPEAVREVPVEMGNISVVAFLAEGHTEIITACEANLSFTNGGPDYILHLSNFAQEAHNTCDSRIRFSAKAEIRAAVEPVSSMDFILNTSDGQREYTHTFEPALEAGSTVTFTSEPIEFPINQEMEASLSLAAVNGSDNFPEMDSLTADFSKYYMNIPSQEMILTVAQDQYGEEITWNVVTDEGDTIGQGGPYANLQNMGTRNRIDTLTLAEGCQTFTIYDATGDGIHNTQGDGHIDFSDIEGNTLLTRDGDYGDSAVVMISYNLPFANENAMVQIKAQLYPNPASENANLRFETEAACQADIKILNQAGQCVLDLGKQDIPAGIHTVSIPVNSLGNGIYIIHVQGQGFQGIQKLIVNR
ncbi:MAG: Omp28-related outer membrane protein [Bacteroidetes bacterium]|uniref:Omp28-related outer membrane protein n=1 Tax=Candidatus Pullibacteroides excrementavium TaxID=2840905 RepID=A0A9D9DQI0_9BACT|nr:Omp28-related outer membrane protein [Candidatus Pullibacteroides excrementavium]